MFKRRKKRNLSTKIKESLWPSMGWKRLFRYLTHRIIRLSGSDYNIAAGLSTGAAISSVPLVGTHILQALALSYVVRGNYISSMIGTLWGNPWTFPFLFYLSYKVGIVALSIVGYDYEHSEDMEMSFAMFLDQNFLPTAVGGYICSILLWPVYLVIFYALIKNAKAARRSYRKIKIKKVAKEITEHKKK